VRTPRRSIGTKIVALTATGLLVAGLAACGSDDDSPSDNPTTPLDSTVDSTLDNVTNSLDSTVDSVLDTLPIDTTVTT